MDSPDFKKIQDDFSELMIFNTDILQISLKDNLLRVLVKDDADIEDLPAIFVNDEGYHIGIEYMTPSRLIKMEEHTNIERLALDSDPDPNKPTRIKVAEYLSKQNQDKIPKKGIWDKIKEIIK